MRLKWLLGALIALTCLSAVWFFELPGGLLLFPVVALVLGAAARPDLVLRAPAWIWNLGFPLLLGGLLVDYLVNGVILEAFMRLNVLLIAFRAVSPRAKRDDLQLLVLCLILVVMAGVLTVSIGFALLILIFAGLGLGFLLLVTLCERASIDATDDLWVRVPWKSVLRRAIALADWRFIGFSAGIFASAILITSLIFLAIPRFEIGSSLGFMGLNNKRSLTGFTDTISFGDVTEIQQDDSTALRIEPSDPAAIPANPYWRMVVLDSYRDGRFRVSRSARMRDAPIPRDQFTIPGTLRAKGDDKRWTFYLEAGVSRFLPLAGPYSIIRLREGAQLFQNPGTNVVALGTEPQKMFAYRVEGMEFDGRIPDPQIRSKRAAAGQALDQTPEEIEDFTQYPATLLQVAVSEADRSVLDRTVNEITGGRELRAEEFARLALGYLAAHHSYSLTSALPPGRGDPLVRWINSNTPGHCEFFAGAFTLLSRTAGFRTRVVTGFAGGTWNAFEGYIMVRNSNAHAWCEIYDGAEWVRVDPTPGAAGLPAPEKESSAFATAGDRSWSAYFDSLRVIWYRRVVDFDKRQQSEVADALKTFSRRSSDWFANATLNVLQRFYTWLHGSWDFWRMLRTSLTALAVVTLLFIAWRTRRRWWTRLNLARSHDPVRARAGVWLGRLQRAGALGLEPGITLELQRLRFGPARERHYPAELFARARKVIREARRRRA